MKRITNIKEFEKDKLYYVEKNKGKNNENIYLIKLTKLNNRGISFKTYVLKNSSHEKYEDWIAEFDLEQFNVRIENDNICELNSKEEIKYLKEMMLKEL